MIKLRYTNNIKKLDLSKNFILSAFNLAFVGFIYNKKIIPNKYFIMWPDGIFAKLFIFKKKIPGSDVIQKVIIDKKIKKIIIMGNATKKEISYLKNKHKKEVNHFDLVYGNIKKIIHAIPKIHKNNLYHITLPTPKQEQLALHISNKYRSFKIICIGGGLAIASKTEKKCPKLIEKIGLEFLWRLKTDFIRRIIRLIYTLSLFTMWKIDNNSSKFLFKNISKEKN